MLHPFLLAEPQSDGVSPRSLVQVPAMSGSACVLREFWSLELFIPLIAEPHLVLGVGLWGVCVWEGGGCEER